MSQYIKISNQIINDFKKQGVPGLKRLGLYAITQTFLSIPGFETPNGGLKNAIIQHCEDSNYTVTKYINVLMEDGYLKRSRLSVSVDKFKDYYLLLNEKDVSVIPTKYIQRNKLQEYLDAHPVCFCEVTNKYMPISRNMIMDANLSLAEKGLYIVLAKFMSLRDRFDLLNNPYITREEYSQYYFTKEMVRKSCGGQYHAFNRVWRGLKYKGYFKGERYYCGVCLNNRTWYYLAGYESKLDKPTATLPPKKNDKDDNDRLKKIKKDILKDDEVPQVELSYNGLNKFFQETLLKRLSPAFKNNSLANDFVQIMIDTILRKKDVRFGKKTFSFKKIVKSYLTMNVVYFENALRIYQTRTSHCHPLRTARKLLYSCSPYMSYQPYFLYYQNLAYN